jgi:tol-pal system protein YbgF
MVQLLFPASGHAQAPVTGPGQTVQSSQNLSIEQRLERLERIMQSQGLLDMLQQLQQLQSEIRMLRGEIETQNYNLEQLTRRQRDLYTDVDQRLMQLEGGSVTQGDIPVFTPGATDTGEPPLEVLTPVTGNSGPVTTVQTDGPLQVEIVNSSPPGSTPGVAVNTSQTNTAGNTVNQRNQGSVGIVTPTQVAAVDPVQLQAEYQQAFNLLRQSRYDQAIRAFQQFLALHPNDRYSDNAQYWLAEAYYVKREFEQALIEYNNVISNFPQSQKVNDALLKIGFTQYELGDMTAARESLQELIDKQPGATVTRLAEERLKLITTSTAPGPVPLPETSD